MSAVRGGCSITSNRVRGRWRNWSITLLNGLDCRLRLNLILDDWRWLLLWIIVNLILVTEITNITVVEYVILIILIMADALAVSICLATDALTILPTADFHAWYQVFLWESCAISQSCMRQSCMSGHAVKITPEMKLYLVDLSVVCCVTSVSGCN